MKNCIIFLLISFLLLMNCGKKIENNELDLYKNVSHFTGGISKGPVPKTRLLKDASNNRIANMCITGALLEELKKLNIQDLEQRLDVLIKGHVLNLVDSRYILSFSAIVGEKREALADIVNDASEELSLLVESMIMQLRKQLENRQDILFHILWSRVIDEVWYKAWKLTFPDEELPNVRWVIYPKHSFSVGTNYYSLPGHSNIALTWSDNCMDHLDFFHEFRFEVHQAAWKKEIKDQKAKEKMRKFGAFDASYQFTIFSYNSGDSLDQTLDNMISEYASKVTNIFDYKKFGQKFNIHYGDIFVIILHETAYAIFENLYKSGKLNMPDSLHNEEVKRDYSQLISVKLGEPPRLSDEAMALFIRNGWRGNREIVEKFKHVTAKEPNNLDIHWYLGQSLYDIEEYDEAMNTFQKLIKLTKGEADQTMKHDWSLIWIAHIYDVLGKREKAISFYKKVLDSKDTASKLQMSQYNIGPINAIKWAQQRIKEPFKRR